MSHHSFQVRTSTHSEFVNISSNLQTICANSEVPDGICMVYIPHTTCGITINEAADPDVKSDMVRALDKLIPIRDNYAHAEGNSAAHIKASLMGFSASVPLVNGRLMLGTWQGVYLCEFDGPRQRTVHVSIFGS